MAVRSSTTAFPGQSVLVTWSGLLNGDTGAPVCLADFPDKSVQVKGTFGAGGSVSMEGSNDGGTTWAALHDPQGNALAQTAASVELIAEHTLLVRPNVTAGDGTTNLVVMLSGVKVL